MQTDTDTINSAREVAERLTERADARGPEPRPTQATHRLRWWRDALRRRMLAVADILAAALATLLATQASTSGLVLLAGLPLWILVA